MCDFELAEENWKDKNPMQIFGPLKFSILEIRLKRSQKTKFLKDCCSNVQKLNSLIFDTKVHNDMEINLHGLLCPQLHTSSS